METPTDLLQLDGIYRQGYGIVPKFVMHDQDLSLESKAIYAYLCALAGSGSCTFPYRDTILRELGISKNTYYRHYSPLLEQGYLYVQRPADKTAANVYTLAANPKKLAGRTSSGDGDSRLRYRGLKAHGYGTIPRMVMTDPRLSVKAKGLYAYFCSYCGAGDCAFPVRDHILYHLGISEPTYYRAYNQLRALGYLVVEQRKSAGRFAVNDYYLEEDPQGDTPCPKNCDTDGVPHPKNRDTKKWDTKNGDTRNRDSISNNRFSNNRSSIINHSRGTTDDGIGNEWRALFLSASPAPQPLQGQIALIVDKLLRPGRLKGRAKTAGQQLHGWLSQPGGQALLAGQLRVFAARMEAELRQRREVCNPSAYLTTSLYNWLCEEPGRGQKPRETASQPPSYDLVEIEGLIDSGAVW